MMPIPNSAHSAGNFQPQAASRHWPALPGSLALRDGGVAGRDEPRIAAVARGLLLDRYA